MNLPLYSRQVGFITATVLFVVFAAPAQALLFNNFNESGTIVNGFQDDFDGTELSPDWLLYDGGGNGPGLFTKSGSGTLLMNPATGDPNKLLYNPVTPYSDAIQEIVALIRLVVDPDGDTDGVRGGVNLASNTFDGQGINLHFREPNQNGNGNHFNLLDDQRAWGPATDPNIGGETWAVGEYKWLRLVQNASGTNFAKIWDAGTAPEPANFDLSWSNRARVGLAGLTTNSIGGQAVLEVDYVLIKAEGLPPTTVAVPEPGSALLVGFAGGLLGLRRRRDGLARDCTDQAGNRRERVLAFDGKGV